MDTPSPRPNPPEEQQCISSPCSPYIGVPVRGSKHGCHDCENQSSPSLGGDCLGVGKEQGCCENRMEGLHHDGTGVAHDPSLKQPDSRKVGRKGHGKGSKTKDGTVDGCRAKATEGTSNTDGARSTDRNTQNEQPDDLSAGSGCNQRSGDDGNCPVGLIQGLRRGRPRSRELVTRRRTVRSSQSDRVTRIFDESDKENQDPQRRTIRDGLILSSQ